MLKRGSRWEIIKAGGGKENIKSNQNRYIDSTREEAAGITLASKWASDNWKGKVNIYSDNESAINMAINIKYTPTTLPPPLHPRQPFLKRLGAI